MELSLFGGPLGSGHLSSSNLLVYQQEGTDSCPLLLQHNPQVRDTDFAAPRQLGRSWVYRQTGYKQVSALHHLSLKIVKVAFRCSTTLQTVHLPGSDNTWTDALS